MRRVPGPIVAAIVLMIVAAFSGGVVTGPTLARQGTPEAVAGGTPVQSSPVGGDTIDFVTESGSKAAELTLTGVVLPWDEYSEYYEPDPGTRYVAFVIEVTNFGTRGSLVVRADDFRLQDVDGFLVSRSIADAAEGAEIVPTGSDIAISPGETGEMIVVFPVLDGVGLSQLFWQPDFDRLLTIATFDDLNP